MEGAAPFPPVFVSTSGKPNRADDSPCLSPRPPSPGVAPAESVRGPQHFRAARWVSFWRVTVSTTGRLAV
jgi:hypothetical protein